MKETIYIGKINVTERYSIQQGTDKEKKINQIQDIVEDVSPGRSIEEWRPYFSVVVILGIYNMNTGKSPHPS